MANLGNKDGIFLARFRVGGREFKRSLKTRDEKEAKHILKRIEHTLSQLGRGEVRLPGGVDPGEFVVSGGAVSSSTAIRRDPIPSLTDFIEEYLRNLNHLAESNRATKRVHLNNLTAALGAGMAARPITHTSTANLELYLQGRLKARSPSTVAKERETLVDFFRLAVAFGYLDASPAAQLTSVKASGELPPFRTCAEIEAAIKRGGLTDAEVRDLWDCLYLTTTEIAELLELVRMRATRDTAYMLHALPAYTGLRRGEVLRLRWTDVEIEQDGVVARSRKQSRQVAESTRRIDLHPELKQILVDWKRQRPKGQHVVCLPDGSPLTIRLAITSFTQPLRRTAWCLDARRRLFKIGFHTYRHSFASNLAAAGVDQRIIDQWMGHQTEAMRRRYRHLFPQRLRSAIQSFSLVVPTTSHD